MLSGQACSERKLLHESNGHPVDRPSRSVPYLIAHVAGWAPVASEGEGRKSKNGGKQPPRKPVWPGQRYRRLSALQPETAARKDQRANFINSKVRSRCSLQAVPDTGALRKLSPEFVMNFR